MAVLLGRAKKAKVGEGSETARRLGREQRETRESQMTLAGICDFHQSNF